MQGFMLFCGLGHNTPPFFCNRYNLLEYASPLCKLAAAILLRLAYTRFPLHSFMPPLFIKDREKAM